MKDLPNEYKNILYKIGYYRNKKNMSAYALSLALGKEQSYMYRVEKGDIMISLQIFLDILTILDVSTFEFFCRDVYKDVENIKLLKSLNEKETEAVLTLLKLRK